MSSKLSIHLSGYPNKTFDVLTKMKPSIVKVFNQSSEMNIDTIRQMSPNTIIVYRQYTNQDYHGSADTFFAELGDTFSKLRGRGILWEGINEPIVQSVDDAKALNAWYVRFAQLMHANGELVAGFSWSTGNPTPDKLSQFIPFLVDAAAAVDVHAFHEYYKAAGQQADWGRYRAFEAALPPASRKPVVITEAGWDDNGDPGSGGFKNKVSLQQYLEILKAYDAVLMQDPYVLGATVFEWGDGGWQSFELSPMIDLIANYVASVGGGTVISKPWSIPVFGPPQPSYSFTATPSSIVAGQSATLKWDCDNVRQVSLDNQVVATHGTKTFTPTTSTTYTLRVTLNDGSVKPLAATIAVTAPTPGVVRITNVSISPATLAPGGVLNVSITVKNDTTQTLQTQGPNPGFVYEEKDSFVSRGFGAVKNAFRVGIDFGGRTGIDHPYRWGLGAPLAPGQTATITGSIRLQTTRSISYWAGLVRELVAWLSDKQGMQVITVAVPPPISQPTFTASPTNINAGQSATLQWNATGASSVLLNGQSVAIQGTQTVTPTQTTTYTLQVKFTDGSTKNLTATVTVAVPPPPIGTTRTPTVVLTPDNIARLKTYPRPTNDNGRGLHFNIDLRDTTNVNTVEHLNSISARWTLIYAQDENQAQRAAQAAWQAGIMPIVRIGKKVDEFFDPVVYVNALKAIGAPTYVQIYNEPGDGREWKKWPGGDAWIGIFAARWAQAAAAVFDAGGYPGLQVLGIDEFNAAVDSVKAIGRTDIWQRGFFVIHNYGANHPPSYPYDARNQQDHPGATILDDDVAVLAFLEIAKWMQDRIGFVLPIIGGEGGWEFGNEEDNRYPKAQQPYHAKYHAEMFNWFRTRVLSNGEPLPDYLFSITPWIEGGWGADDWWFGPLGTKTETINVVQAIQPFVRKFSWDG